MRTWFGECILHRLSISKTWKSAKCIHQHNRYEHFDTVQRKAHTDRISDKALNDSQEKKPRLRAPIFRQLAQSSRLSAPKNPEPSEMGRDERTNFHRSVRANGNEKWYGTRHSVRRSSTDWHQCAATIHRRHLFTLSTLKQMCAFQFLFFFVSTFMR